MSYSILMSVYYNEKPEHLRESIDSMLRQTVKSDDFVIVCDGPLGMDLDEVISEYEGSHPGLFNIFRMPKNNGLAKALNAGLKQCKNEIVARMDSDDISAPDRIKKEIEAMEQHNADIVGCDAAEFCDSISKIQAIRHVPSEHRDILKFSRSRSPFNHPSVMFKRSKVVDSGYYKNFRYFEDYGLWVTMLNNGCIGYNIPEILLYMRAGDELYKRRGGVKYIPCIFCFEKYLWSCGYIGFLRFAAQSLARAAVSIIPSGIRKKLYSGTLRN